MVRTFVSASNSKTPSPVTSGALPLFTRKPAIQRSYSMAMVTQEAGEVPLPATMEPSLTAACVGDSRSQPVIVTPPRKP